MGGLNLKNLLLCAVRVEDFIERKFGTACIVLHYNLRLPRRLVCHNSALCFQLEL